MHCSLLNLFRWWTVCCRHVAVPLLQVAHQGESNHSDSVCILQHMSTKNLSDARLAVHQRISDALVDLFAGGENYTDEDVETAADIADELMAATGIEVIDVVDGRAIVAIPMN